MAAFSFFRVKIAPSRRNSVGFFLMLIVSEYILDVTYDKEQTTILKFEEIVISPSNVRKIQSSTLSKISAKIPADVSPFKWTLVFLRSVTFWICGQKYQVFRHECTSSALWYITGNVCRKSPVSSSYSTRQTVISSYIF